jgi:repressor LexA
LRRDPTKPRAMELLVDRAKRAVRSQGLPLVGQVAAGEPVLAEENIEEYLDVPAVVGGEHGDYVLRIKGDSMRDAGILEGDYVVVRQADDAKNGEIVVALIEDEATCKRYYPEGDRIRFQPANKTMAPIFVHRTQFRSTMILGQVVGVYRKVH